MYYRITTFSYAINEESEMLEWLNSAREEMKSLPGVQFGHVVRLENGKAMMVGAYDSEESARIAQTKVQALRERMMEVLASPPKVAEGPVIWEI